MRLLAKEKHEVAKETMDVHQNGSTQCHSHPKLQIVTMMSVPPLKVTDPRRVRQVLVSDYTMQPKTIGGCYQIVLYYNQYNEEDSGWSLASWIVESLAKTLLEQPLLAGRLQRRENNAGNDAMRLEIVSNDSGIRLLEAKFPLSLSQFLELNEKENLESELVFWKEIDDQNPEFSPLFYVQVTNFECGGYSIGISCSLLLAEVLVVDNFLKKWAEIHNKMMLPQNGEINNNQKPIFYHPCLKNPDSLPNDVISRTLGKNGSEIMIFKFTTKDDASFDNGLWRELAMLCVEDAEQENPEVKMGSEFSIFVKESMDVIKVESCFKNGYNSGSVEGLGLKTKICRTKWNDFGLYEEVAFFEGNKPILVSCWIGCVGEGHVMAVPYHQEDVSAVIIVSPPR